MPNQFFPNQSRWEVSYRESELDYVNYGYKDANDPQFFPVGGQYIAMRPGYLFVDLPAPTPTPTPTITPTPTMTPTINVVESIGGDTLITLEGDIITSI